MSSVLQIWLTVTVLLFTNGALARSETEFDRHAASALASYEAKDYEKAIAEFSAAYALDPKPTLLISIGRCHYRAGRPREALTYYDRVLREKSDRHEREEATTSKISATLLLQEQDKKTAEQQRAADQARHDAQIAALTSTVQTSAPDKKPLYKKGWFWGVIGGSVAAVGLALGLGLGLGLHPTSNPGPELVIK